MYRRELHLPSARRNLSKLAGWSLLLVACITKADDGPKYRTDANPNKSLKWYQLEEGKFPPADAAHAINGELIRVDHLERQFLLRVDRDDTQDRGVWDLPVDATMLPYGSIFYRGSPAALKDIPLGTHLHGLFYLKDPNDTRPMVLGPYNDRKTPDADFRRCIRLEDDFTFHQRQQQLWKIESVDLKAMRLTATLQHAGEPVSPPRLFDLLTSTRVYQESGFGKLETLKPGQLALFNLTWVTLYGPGRIVDAWCDEPSRQLAREQQLETHRNHIRERGLAGWVDAVDDEKQIVTITFFDGVDPKLFLELTGIDPEPFGWPLSKPENNPTAPKGTIAVALPSLMTYDPVNDRKGGNILSIRQTGRRTEQGVEVQPIDTELLPIKGKSSPDHDLPLLPGNSGVQIQVQCDMLLEGFRPTRIVRFFPASWKVNALPREEEYIGRE